ncbi:hypothetical protein ACIHDR_03490 [Nocardia sp. NPDC052278]|uniref:hypothetical protein n=1 Tax=unclassified Nocardia TaxID=2637762 RepID=UPI003677F397
MILLPAGWLDQLSVSGGAPDDIAFPPGSLEWMKRPEIPNLYGGYSGTPSWWDKIVDYVGGEVWPNAITDTAYRAVFSCSQPVKAVLGTWSSMAWCGLIVL